MKEILVNSDLFPSDIDDYSKMLEDTIRKILHVEPSFRRIINNANSALRKYKHKGKKDTRRGRKKLKVEEVPEELDLEKDEDVAKLLNDFKTWKLILFEIENNAGRVVYLRKRIKSNPNDEESWKTLRELLDFLGFLESDDDLEDFF